MFSITHIVIRVPKRPSIWTQSHDGDPNPFNDWMRLKVKIKATLLGTGMKRVNILNLLYTLSGPKIIREYFTDNRKRKMITYN